MTVELDVMGMVYGGDAICNSSNGLPVFTPYCLPGERVLAEIRSYRKGYATADLSRILRPSSERIQPLCRHFMECGGCSYQHMSYRSQIKIKEDILKEQLSRLGKIVSPPVYPMIKSSNEWQYRNVMQFHIDPQGRLGLKGHRSHQIIPLSECRLPSNEIAVFLSNLTFSQDHNIERLDIRVGSDQTILITMKSKRPAVPRLFCKVPASIVHHYRDHAATIAGENFLRYRVSNQEFKVSAGSFFQVNTVTAAEMVWMIRDYVQRGDFSTIFDLYAGVGLFSKFLAPLCNRIVAIESSSTACDDYSENLDQFSNSQLYPGSVEKILPRITFEADLVLLDPPRAGLRPEVISSIARISPKAIIYVSCDPSTLARDLRMMIQQGFILTKVVPVDMFPQTYHIESVSFLER